MTKRLKAINNTVATVLLIGFCLGGVSAAWAMWAAVPLDELLRDNPVVVAGKITKIDVAAAPGKGESLKTYDTAYLTVSKVLKNTLPRERINPGARLPLAMPAANRRIATSVDLRYRKGIDGIWILEFKSNRFWATYPGDRQPREKEKEIVALLARQKGMGDRLSGILRKRPATFEMTLMSHFSDDDLGFHVQTGVLPMHDSMFPMYRIKVPQAAGIMRALLRTPFRTQAAEGTRSQRFRPKVSAEGGRAYSITIRCGDRTFFEGVHSEAVMKQRADSILDALEGTPMAKAFDNGFRSRLRP